MSLSILDRPRVYSSTTRRLAGGCLILLALAAYRPAGAATIRSSIAADFPAGTSPGQIAAIQRFVNAGPTYWAWHEPPAFPALSRLHITNTDGTLKNDNLVQYLAFRRSLSPILFDLRHPQIGTLFLRQAEANQQAQLAAFVTYLKGVTNASTVKVVGSSTASTASSSGRTSAQTLSVGGRSAAEILIPLSPAPTPVPEPSTALTTLAALGIAGAWYRLRRVRRDAETV